MEFWEYLTEAPLGKADMTFPVAYGDPFFLPDSVREPIPGPGGQSFNCKAYAATGIPGLGFDVPVRPVYTAVTADQAIVVYFELQNAVTVHYVEHGNPANVLRNDDDFLAPVVAPQPGLPLPPVLSSMGKRYVYEGYYSLDGGATFVQGPIPDLTDPNLFQGGEDVTLYYSTAGQPFAIDANHVVILQYIPMDHVVERFRDVDNENSVLLSDRVLPKPYGPASWVPPDEIYVDASHIYAYCGYRLDGPVGVPNGGAYVMNLKPDPAAISSVTAHITYLYYNTAKFLVEERYAKWSDPGASLLGSSFSAPITSGDYWRGSKPRP